MARVLVVDDEPSHRDSLRRILERASHEVTVAPDGAAAVVLLQEHASQQPFDVILTDFVMPKMDGMALLKAAKTIAPDVDVVLMTAYGTVENAVSAMREGAYDFLVKPTKRNEVLACITRAAERQMLVRENHSLRAALAVAHTGESTSLVGTSPAFVAVRALLEQVAPSNVHVLLQGEAGTGKEACARLVHQLSPRAHLPFVSVSCAALPDAALEAELFGHEQQQQQSRIEQASGGTLFLDEVADVPLTLQPRLLRVLSHGELWSRSSPVAKNVDVRVVLATQVDLSTRVAQGLFRKDLFEQINVVALQLPPLRKRDGDIALLAMHFLRQAAQRHRRGVVAIEERALEALVAYDFPGNVRELAHAVERAVVLCPGDTLRAVDLPFAITAHEPRTTDDERTLTFRVGQTLETIERAAIAATLKHTSNDKNLTAKLLGVSLRTLYRRIGERADDAVDADPGSDGT